MPGQFHCGRDAAIASVDRPQAPSYEIDRILINWNPRMLLPGLPLLPTTIVGSYPQPDWLIDREGLKSRLPPRVRAQGLWRIQDPRQLADAQEAATLVAISDQKLAGIDIGGDGGR